MPMPMPLRVRNLQRWRHVQSVLLRYGFDMLIEQEDIKEVRRFLQKNLRIPTGDFSDKSLPERVRLMLQELGPTFVKLGQMLSSRRDLLPEIWITELTKLQDNVAPIPEEKVRAVILQELGAPPEKLFQSFDPEPLGAASIGQVHRATLHNAKEVVVKVQRPGIVPQIESDIEIMREVARLAESRTTLGRKYGVLGIVDEFAQSLADELDYQIEGRNAERLRRNMATFSRVHVPIIYWELVTSCVLTMEYIQGPKINCLEKLDRAGIDRKKLADTFIQSMFKQLLIDGFFHADPHPGNLFVDLESGVLTFLDLGMMGRSLEEQRLDMGDLVLALRRQDTHDVVRISMAIGSVYRPVKEMALRRDIVRLLDRYMTLSLSNVSFAHLMNEVVNVLFEHGIRLPHELALGVKALMQAEEIACILDPEIQIVDIAERIARQLIWQRFKPRNLLTRLAKDGREMLRLLNVLPPAIEELLEQIQSGKLTVALDVPGWAEQIQHLYVIGNRLTAGLVLAGMTIGSAIAMGVSPHESWAFIPFLGMIGFIVSVLIGSAIVWRVLLDLWRARN